ncbi:hypothetical protein HGRIS_003753 [Hohenbuehelia grisea]|uniref:Uncharacterized protein n=1 Tax=Hohenbuehelia grisea TaxID=104357 RepID=A0ABR3JHA2_9AGAR
MGEHCPVPQNFLVSKSLQSSWSRMHGKACLTYQPRLRLRRVPGSGLSNVHSPSESGGNVNCGISVGLHTIEENDIDFALAARTGRMPAPSGRQRQQYPHVLTFDSQRFLSSRIWANQVIESVIEAWLIMI